MRLIQRDTYLNKLKNVVGTPDIKVITGIRRCGKSTLLSAFRTYVETTFPDANVIFVDLDDRANDPVKKDPELYDHIMGKYLPGVRNFVMIDEVQECRGFERTVEGLRVSGKFDIYITGSNAFLLSSDLITLFTGRTFEIKVYPFSFAEFCEYNSFPGSDMQTSLDRYMEEGGMPGSYAYGGDAERREYVSEIFDTIMERDICSRHKIRNTEVLRRICRYLMDNTSNITSSRKIEGFLSANKEPLSHNTVERYVGYMCESFLFYRIPRYDIHGKKNLLSNDKYYLCDHSFRRAVPDPASGDRGRVLENIVAMELLRRGYRVFAGMLYEKEVDFVAVRWGETIYVQVSEDISREETFEREIAPLQRIRDNYPKYLLARTDSDDHDVDGIKIIDLARWLLS